MLYEPGPDPAAPRPLPPIAAAFPLPLLALLVAAPLPRPRWPPRCRGRARRRRAVQARRGRASATRRRARARRRRRVRRALHARGQGRDGASVAAGARGCARRPGVLSATAELHRARVRLRPARPRAAGAPGGWQALQWNFLPVTGVDAPDAWQHLIDAGRPGGQGVMVAVLDTGIAYANRGRFRRSPDFSSIRFVHGYDFVDDDAYPNDDNGHGTHVAGTIAEGTGNGVGADRAGLRREADAGARCSTATARATRCRSPRASAGRPTTARRSSTCRSSSRLGHHAPADPEHPRRAALRPAKGVLVVGAVRQRRRAAPSPTRRARSDVLSVGATTEHGCLADYSNEGQDLDIVAPGGGADATLAGDPNCHPVRAPAATSSR